MEEREEKEKKKEKRKKEEGFPGAGPTLLAMPWFATVRCN
jgi:hypothetical protein